MSDTQHTPNNTDPFRNSARLVEICEMLVGVRRDVRALAADRDRLAAVNAELVSALEDFSEHVISYVTQWEPGKGSHHHPIWVQVADVLARARGES